MSTKMRILGWRVAGLRCPDHEIDCCNSHGVPIPITLIQMPNGTGKTTTLTLIRAALSGSADKWDQFRIGELKKNSDEIEGFFELRLSLNDKRLTIRINIDFEAGDVTYKTTWGSGQNDGFHPPRELKRFMTQDFVNFYIFDGELAENLLKHDHTDAETAVESLFQIHLLKQMVSKVEEYWDEKTKIVTAKDATGFTRRNNMLDRWRNRLVEIVQKIAKHEAKIKETNEYLQTWGDQYNKEIEKQKDSYNKIQKAENTVSKLTKQADDQAKNVLDEMRDPHALSPAFEQMMVELKSGLDRVKLPESAAREFFEELAREVECVCGREIDDEIRDVIKERAQQYLGSEDVSLLNSMKSTVMDAVGDSKDQTSQMLLKSISTLSDLADKLQKSKNERDDLRYTVEQSNPAVSKARDQIDHLESMLDIHEKKLQRYLGKDESVKLEHINKLDPGRISAIETIKEGIEKLEIMVAEVAKTIELRWKRNKLKDIIDTAHTLARNAIAEEIRDEANQRIGYLMPYNNIRIENINRCLELQGKSGGSVGETLSVGYAFLSTLFNRTEQHELPFVVDSPANPIDLEIRSNIGELVPRLTGQFIAFMISSERERFLDGLNQESDMDILYVTLFKKGASHFGIESIRQFFMC